MKTLHDILRARLLSKVTPPKRVTLEELRRTEWSPQFERYMRNRLVMGALRYGRLGVTGKPVYDRVRSMVKRLSLYAISGNREYLVDVANLCLLEFEEGIHPNAHWAPSDDGEHVAEGG
jgi:hypothetical protein